MVGSSRKSSSGSPTSAQPSDSRCFCPPDKRAHLAVGLVLQADQREHLADAETAGIEAPKQRHHFGHGQLLGKLRFLELDAESCPQRQVVAAPPIAQDLDIPRVGHAKAFEDLDGRGLAGAVRTEHAETLAGADLEIEAGHRGDVAVVLGQAAAAKRLGS